MTEAAAQSQPWPRSRWWLAVGAVMAGQVGLIFWLSGRDPIQRAAAIGPGIFVTANPNDRVPGLRDPTLFVLPSAHGFSGPAWLTTDSAGSDAEKFRVPDWDQGPQWLALETNKLGGWFREFARTNGAGSLQLARHAAPNTEPLAVLPQIEMTPSQSTVTLEGPLASRRLITPIQPPVWPASGSILTNGIVLADTEVLAHVARDGAVFTSVVVSKSGLPEADNLANDLVRRARFQPLPEDGRLSPAEQLTTGRVIFHWVTVAPAEAGGVLVNP